MDLGRRQQFCVWSAALAALSGVALVAGVAAAQGAAALTTWVYRLSVPPPNGPDNLPVHRGAVDDHPPTGPDAPGSAGGRDSDAPPTLVSPRCSASTATMGPQQGKLETVNTVAVVYRFTSSTES